MSEPMKKRPISVKNNILHIVHNGETYDIPKTIADKYKTSLKPSEGAILADDFFTELDQKHTKPGILLRGIRTRENLSQVAFSREINVTQSDLSKMERGKRPIGKIIAKRIAEKFDINYRLLLG